MKRYWPQITLVALFAAEFGWHVANHGRPYPREVHMGWEFLSILIVFCLLYLSDFFKAGDEP